jgi:hypothetical protein
MPSSAGIFSDTVRASENETPFLSCAFSCPLKWEQLPNADIDGSKRHANGRFFGQTGGISGGMFEESKFGTSASANTVAG